MEQNATVVQWLKEKLIGHLDISERYKKELFEQAEEMEKQRIKDEREEAYNNGYANGQMDAFTKFF